MSFGLSQSAQTLAPGKVQHQFGLEWFHLSGDRGDYLPPFAMPYYGLRAGISEGVDIGFRSNVTLSNLGFDLKLQPVDTEALDVAIVPTLQYAWIWGWTHLPVVLGFNLSDRLQVVLSGRIAYAFPLVDDADPTSLEESFGTGSQTVAGGGLGLYVQIGRRFAILPEVQAVRGFGGSDPVILAFTLGFTFGDQPGAAPEPETPRVLPTEPGPPPYPTPDRPPIPSGPPPGAAPATPPGYGPPSEEPPPG